MIASALNIGKFVKLFQTESLSTISFNQNSMVDVPDGLEDLSEVVIFGVESEQIEEENDAYNDLRAELGEDRETSSVTF